MALLGAKGQVGQLRVGFTSSAIFRPIVPEIVRAFHQHHPEVELTLTENDTTQLLQLLGENKLSADLGVSIVPASIAAQIQVKGVVYLPIVGESPAFGLALATRLKEKSTAVQNFHRLAAACEEGVRTRNGE